MTVSVVIAAGGSGGHLVPALAIADAVRRAEPSAQIALVGSARALERQLVSGADYPVHTTSVRTFRTRAGMVGAAFSTLRAARQARRILRVERAMVVVGMGGYPSLPVVMAARRLRIPSIVHEANAFAGLGLANQIAARLTPHIAVSWDETARALAPRRTRLVGVPLRAGIARIDRARLRAEALAEFDLSPARRTVLVFGGSQGAARLNSAAAGLADAWRSRDDVQLLLAAGRGHAEAVAAALGGTNARVLAYVERMDLAYAAADIAVARAGASTVAELASAGLASVLVPLPIARRREQDANARALASRGAAVVLDDASCDAIRLAGVLGPLLADAGRLAAMGAAARTLARPQAADDMAAWVLELAGR